MISGLVGIALISMTAAADAPAPLVPVLVLVPTTAPNVAPGLSLAMNERANALLLGAGRFSVVHARQLLAMASRHRMATETFADLNVARQAAERLGAQHFVTAEVRPLKSGFEIVTTASSVGSAKTTTSTTPLPMAFSELVKLGGDAMAKALGTAAGVEVSTALEMNAADVAVRDAAACGALLLQQPIGIENPTVLNEADVRRGLSLCKSAVKASPNYAEAQGSLALAAAIYGDNVSAVLALETAKGLPPRHVPNTALARFWLATKYQSNEAGEAALKEAIAKEPGFLLARGYLAEFYNTLGRHAEAAAAWREFAALTPNTPFITSRLAYTLARLGKPDDAASFAEKALSLDPQSVDLALELGGRYLDAGAIDKAIDELERLTRTSPNRPDVWLRYGYALEKKGVLKEAGVALDKALSLATAPGDWKVRGRAHLDLASAALKREALDDAKRHLTEAAKEGVRPPADAAALNDLLTPTEWATLRPATRLRTASPLPMSNGEVDATQSRPTAPKGLDAAMQPAPSK